MRRSCASLAGTPNLKCLWLHTGLQNLDFRRLKIVANNVGRLQFFLFSNFQHLKQGISFQTPLVLMYLATVNEVHYFIPMSINW